MNDFVMLIGFVLYGISVGWLLHSYKHDIVWFFRDNWVAIFCWFVALGWPILTLATFFVSLYLKFELLLHISFVSIVGYVIFGFWMLREIRKYEKQQKRNEK